MLKSFGLLETLGVCATVIVTVLVAQITPAWATAVLVVIGAASVGIGFAFHFRKPSKVVSAKRKPPSPTDR